MRLVQTSAWIKWLIGSGPGATLAGELPERQQWLVPTTYQLKRAKWLTRKAGEDKADQAIAFIGSCNVAEHRPNLLKVRT